MPNRNNMISQNKIAYSTFFILFLFLVNCSAEQPLAQEEATEQTSEVVTEYVRIEASAADGGKVSNVNSSYTKGEKIILIATPDPGYIFEKWSNNSTENPLEMTLDSDTEVIAYFTLVDRDLDGINDENDQCPDSPARHEVNENGCGISPIIVAQKPTIPADEVVSIYSDSYTNNRVDFFLTNWSNGEIEEVYYYENKVKKYSKLGFFAIETAVQQIDISTRLYLEFDLWSPNLNEFRVKLVDFGPNGTYEGAGQGDDTEATVTVDAIEKSEWVHIKIPLTDFTELQHRENIAQFIFYSTEGEENYVYIDNILFSGPAPEVDEVTPPEEPQEGPLNLVWNDEFDVDGRPDTDKWHHQTYAPNGGSWFNGELQHYVNKASTTYVSEGTLKIVAKKEPYTTQNRRKEYTSARLNSKFSFKYGRVDVRAKLPGGEGTWPAIWTLGTNIDEAGNYYGSRDGSVGWPSCGEIDILEQNGWDKSQVYGYFHWGNPLNQGAYENAGTTTRVNNTTTEFHIYSLIWDENEMKIAVDDVVFFTLSNNPTNPYKNRHYLLLNIAVGGNLGGNVPTSFNTEIMEVDYVRVYQR